MLGAVEVRNLTQLDRLSRLILVTTDWLGNRVTRHLYSYYCPSVINLSQPFH